MITPDFEFAISSKNKEILVVEGHEFYVKRLNKFTTAWNCSKYQSYKCRVSALTQDDQLIRVNGEHNHSASIGKPATQKVIKEIKDLSENLTPERRFSKAPSFGLGMERLNYRPKTSIKYTPFMYMFSALPLLVYMPSFPTKRKKRTADYLMP